MTVRQLLDVLSHVPGDAVVSVNIEYANGVDAVHGTLETAEWYGIGPVQLIAGFRCVSSEGVEL
jgi:hypothetical protein